MHGQLLNIAYSLAILLGVTVSPVFSQVNEIECSSATGSARPVDAGHQFSAADTQLLEDIQHGCLNYLWFDIGSPGCLVKDRHDVDVSSIAAVGFQLSSLPICVEHGWVSKEEAQQRAFTVLRTLIERSDNKKFGVYLHFLDQHTGGLKSNVPELQASTVDHALLLAGALPTAAYFGGEVARLVEKMERDTNWKAFVNLDEKLICFGWRFSDPKTMQGEGAFRPWMWKWASDEERLVYFLAVGGSQEAHRVDPSMYYRLERRVTEGEDSPFVMSWNGALFTYFFSHCWIDYSKFAADEPANVGGNGPRVDWLENSRRAMLSHTRKCAEKSTELSSFLDGRWGSSPCTGFRDGRPTYWVPAIPPNIAEEQQWCEGTVTPYAAGSTIVFTPPESMAAFRAFRNLKVNDQPVWRDVANGGFGLADSFSVDQGRVSWDIGGIDCGPMLLAIENVRIGLIWRLFHEHQVAKDAVQRLKWQRW